MTRFRRDPCQSRRNNKDDPCPSPQGRSENCCKGFPALWGQRRHSFPSQFSPRASTQNSALNETDQRPRMIRAGVFLIIRSVVYLKNGGKYDESLCNPFVSLRTGWKEGVYACHSAPN